MQCTGKRPDGKAEIAAQNGANATTHRPDRDASASNAPGE
jgi:hypothetical protein